MTDDYFDYKHAVDQLKPGEKNPYSGGSGTLTSGEITPKKMMKVIILLYSITICIGIYLIIERGFLILAFGMIGVFSSVFYTAPPIKFSHHGLGELGMLVNFGLILGLGSFYVQAQFLSLEALFATLPCGIMLFSMIIINEIPDIHEDKQAGKLTLIARYGPNLGIQLYTISWLCSYLVILIGIALAILPLYTLVVLFTLPLTYRSMHILRQHYANPLELAPANLDMIRAHSVFSLFVILTYLIQGTILNRNLNDAIGFMLFFLLFYFPAAVFIINDKKR